MTTWQQFYEKWNKGCGAVICPLALKVCLAKGRINPCEIVFIGEAPGSSENVHGIPFVGPAGHLLDSIVTAALHRENFNRNIGEVPRAPVACAYTNLVGCLPRDLEEGGKAEQPDPDDILKCQPRLVEFVKICNPKLLVAVGALATRWIEKGYRMSAKFHRDIPTVSIDHPSYILRANTAQREFLKQRAIVVIDTAVLEHVA